MASRFKKPQSGKAVPVIPETTPAYLESQIGVTNRPQPKAKGFSLAHRGTPSAAIWAVLSAIGSGLKSDVQQLAKDPIGTLGATVDEWTVGQEARNRFKQGDVAGAINNSGIGQLFALPEMERAMTGKMQKADPLWLALTYGTGPLGKGIKALSGAGKKATNKALINYLTKIK